MIIQKTNNKITFPPSFEGGKVYFYKIRNFHLAQEGEDWEFSVVKEYPLNKTDRKGQPMWLREVELILPEIPKPKTVLKYSTSKIGIKYVYAKEVWTYYREGGRISQKGELFYLDKNPEKFSKEEVYVFDLIEKNEKILGVEITQEIREIKYYLISVDVENKTAKLKKRTYFWGLEKTQIVTDVNPLTTEIKEEKIKKDNFYNEEEITVEIEVKKVEQLLKIYEVHSEYVPHDYHDSGSYVESAKYIWARVFGYKCLLPFEAESNYRLIKEYFVSKHYSVVDESNEFEPDRGLNNIVQVIEEKDWDGILPSPNQH